LVIRAIFTLKYIYKKIYSDIKTSANNVRNILGPRTKLYHELGRSWDWDFIFQFRSDILTERATANGKQLVPLEQFQPSNVKNLTKKIRLKI